MTIFHKSMLAGAALIGEVEDDPQLNCILLEPEGETAAINRWAIFASSPVPGAVLNSLPLSGDVPLTKAVAVSTKQILELVKTIPADRQFKSLLEHVSITNAEGNILTATFNNGRGNQSVVLRSIQASGALFNWKERMKELRTSYKRPATPFVFNRLRLKTVVAAIEASCKYLGEFDYVAQRIFDNGYIWSVKNGQTGQQVVVSWVMPTGDPEVTPWEQELFAPVKLFPVASKCALKRPALKRP